MPATLSDDQLLRLVMAADEDAFTTLYRRRQGAIYRFALQMSGCNQIAEDVTQEVFMELMREPERYDAGRGTLSAYLYGIARNHVLRRLRRDRCYVPFTETDEGDGATVDGRLIAPGDPLDDLTRNESIEALRRAVLALPEHYREAVVLCDLHEMNYAEAAGALACSVGTIRSRLHRGRALLAEKLRAADRESRVSTLTSPARCLA
ncbi:MAG: RNA polymerase sigma factor [Blastocatellia bacterium]|nr:RNA polymerase sigma factor [Blastocatellia bacterium]